jgi:beta-galactosidase
MKIPFNRSWEYTEAFNDSFLLKGEGAKVDLPHTVKEVPFNCFDEKELWKTAGYAHEIPWKEEYEGKRIFIEFMAAGHYAEVFLDGEKIGTHACGYTSFKIELTGKLKKEGPNRLVVKLDSTEKTNIPPFGFVIDYLCYGGLYREVYLEIEETTFISDVFFFASGNKKAVAQVTLSGLADPEDSLLFELFDKDGLAVGQSSLKAEASVKFEIAPLEVHLWDVSDPYLYTGKVSLIRNGKAISEFSHRIGFRTALFKSDGFYLNGKKLKLRGLNRHQSYPYLGYALPDSIQKDDADILKNELGLNAVRTSHYPDSQSFFDRCDEIGLLAFTEIPGWQHIGDEEWKRQAIQNTEEMVLQYRNHPSIFLWGVRINESQDDDEFYKKTNEVARRLDPTRQTSGVRYLEKSSLLEDVYAHNDFSHTGDNRGLKKKKKASPDMNKGYFVSEFNGHMFPTKTFDNEPHQLLHALRYARVLDDMYSSEDIGGCFGWCAFDYNTHQDFGSGDRICYHGVADMFRNLKLAGEVYASQQDKTPVLAVSNSMNKGEYPASLLGDIWVFTNADSVKLYRDDEFAKEFFPDRKDYPSLPHPPILIDDLVGEIFFKNEKKYSHKDAERMIQLMMGIIRYGTKVPKKTVFQALPLLLKGKINFKTGNELYAKYFGGWGGKAPTYKFEAIKDGKVVKTVYKSAAHEVHLEMETLRNVLQEGETYDMAMVRIQAKDENGNILPYYLEPVSLSVTGPLEIVGPHEISLPGGTFGTYVKTVGQKGSGVLKAVDARGHQAELRFEIK